MAFAISALPAHERPRERLLSHGPEALSDRELLALVIRQGTRAVSSLELASALLVEYGSLAALAQARPEELSAKTGIGIAKAAALVAAFHLSRRIHAHHTPIVLRGHDDVAAVAQRELSGLRRERVLVLVCDAANRLRRTVIVSEGSLDRALMPLREILNAVLRHDGRSFAVAHNHPSGYPEPSESDLQATLDIRAAAQVVGLRFLGHYISAGDQTREV
jgi:DNA repair protein RadC